MPTHDISGILCLNKPQGATSHDMVNKMRRLFGTKKVGHTGTLDPLATGVLVILIGRAVKASEFLLSQKKEYIAEIKLGYVSDTLDISGSTEKSFDGDLPDEMQIRKALTQFVGSIKQVPPMYSAIKRDGKKLYELARQGVSVEREEREVTVYALEYLGKGEDEGCHSIRIECSKGTYIRTLCDDIGKALGCGALMSKLCRTKNADFCIESSYTPEQLENMTENERAETLNSIESGFFHLQSITLPPFYEKLARCGNEIYLKKIGIQLEEDTLVRLCSREGFFAVGRVLSYPDGLAVKPVKQFDI